MDPFIKSILSQAMLGLNNGAFYAMLSLGLAVIFGLLNIVNFAHGAFYMLGAFLALIGLTQFGGWIGMPELRIDFWWALLLSPLIVGLFSIVIERTMLKRLAGLDHLYGLLLTFGIALVLQGFFGNFYNMAGTPYPGIPPSLRGVVDLGFMYFPKYRLFALLFSLAVCFVTWYAIERTRLGALLRASTENPKLVEAFGVNVPLYVTITYGFGAALAALAGVLAAPIYSVSPLMGAEAIIVVFAIVVIGGMGSILGAIVTGLSLGLIEGVIKVVYPPAANLVVFVIMVIVLMVRPKGLFGRE